MNNENLIFAGCIIWLIATVVLAFGSWVGSKLGEDCEEIDPYDFSHKNGE